ncbi:MAG: hypothetical protein R3D83_00120 [Caenibius sp.]
MSKSSEKKDGARPGRGKLKLLVGALVLLGVGAGGAMGAVQAGLIGHAKEASEPDPPRLVMKGAEDPFAPAAGKGEGEQARAVYGEGGSKFRTAYTVLMRASLEPQEFAGNDPAQPRRIDTARRAGAAMAQAA